MRGDGFRPNDFRPNGLRQRADAVRSIPLADVLAKWGADRDRLDPSRWHTQRGPVSITDHATDGGKFFNWHSQQGGGGAIDLVMHLGDWEVVTAVRWLAQHMGDPERATSITDAAPISPANLGPARSSPSSLRSSSAGASQSPSLAFASGRFRQPPTRPSLSNRAASSVSEYHPIADRVGKAVRGPTRQCRLSDGDGQGSATDRRRVARHGPASLARLGPRHSQGRGLFLDWPVAKLDFVFDNNCTLRIGD